MKRAIVVTVTVLLIAAGAWGILRLRQNTVQLQRKAADLRRQAQTREQSRDEKRRLETMTAQLGRNDAEGGRALHADLEDARREIARLELRAREMQLKAAGRSSAMNVNRDPEKGLTRLEHFQNVGRGSPGQALQTLVWGAIKGENAALIGALVVTGAAREKADALRARLPESARAQYPTPESLAALPMADEILRGGSLQILGQTMIDPQTAAVSLRTDDRGKEVKLIMQLGPGGWRLVVPESALAAIERRMSEVPPKGTPGANR